MSTESIQARPGTMFKYIENEIKLTAIAAEAIAEGQKVVFSGDGEVSIADDDELDVIGTAMITAAIDQPITIAVGAIYLDQLCIIKNATGVVGQKVMSTPTVDADGLLEVTLATSGKAAIGIIMDGGAQDTKVRVGLYHVPQAIT